MTRKFSEVLQGWTAQDLANLCSLLEIKESSTLEEILERIKWLYHSKARATGDATTRNMFGKLRSKTFGVLHESVTVDDLREMPTYNQLIIDACKHLKAFEEGATIDLHEIFMSQAIIIAALQRMKPSERKKFFEEQINFPSLGAQAGVFEAGFRGPLTTFAILGATQLSGFGAFAASTTALGFLTHAVGVTLPFAIYTGMTSTIAFIMGPAGWLAAGVWGAWNLTQPKWKKLTLVLVYIVATNSRRQFEHPNEKINPE